MTKIIRPDADVKAFASNSLASERTVFGEETIADEISDNISSNYLRGWGFVGTSGLPTFQDFNAMGYTISQLNAYLFQMGITEWSINQTYYTGSIVNNGGLLYRSLKDDNKGNDLTNTDYWQSFLSSATDSDSETIGATLKGLKASYDLANAALSRINGGTVTGNTNFTEKLQNKGSDVLMLGEIRLLPFRIVDLPFGWYFANGDAYELSSDVGIALNGLSDNYKTDWGIIKTTATITLPNMFYSDGRGYFLRSVDGNTRQVGSVEGDAIRNITGEFYHVSKEQGSGSGAFTSRIGAQITSAYYSNSHTGPIFTFNASNVVPTAIENRTLNIGMTPAIYLGA